MKEIALYLTNNPLIAIFLCIGLGYLVGKVKIGSFSFGATASTLIIAMVLCLWVSQYTTFTIDKTLRTVFFAMFTFSLGFDVGPGFFKALRSSGIKIVFLAIAYAVAAGGLTLLAGKLLHYNSSTIIGLFAGAFTQTAILGDDPSENLLLAYTLTYFVGTICSILFARYFLPLFLKVDLLKETKRKSESFASVDWEESDNIGIVQTRAFVLQPQCDYIGKTVEEVEQLVHGAAEIEMLYRNDQKIRLTQDTVLCEGDVLTVVGDVGALNSLDRRGMTDVADAKYFSIKQHEAQIVLTNDLDEEIYSTLTSHGIFLADVEHAGKRSKNVRGIDLKKGDILHVHGPENAIKQAVAKLGYIKDNGITTDIPFFSFALMFGLMIGSISFMVMGKQIGLGASFGALIIGLISGWFYDRNPRHGHIAESTLWFIKSIGLNLYIAALGLTSALTAAQLLSVNNLILLGVGVVLAILARIPVMLFGKFVLKLDTVDLVGGMCGSGTNTPALNAVTEYTGSSLYALSFAPGYAVGNVALIVVGLILGYL